MLKRKMLRDIKINLSQFITIFLMVMIGVMAYVGIKAYMDGMQNTATVFYSENNLQDLNVIGKNLTKSDVTKIKDLENVNDAEGKLSVTATSNEDKTLLLNAINSNNISKFYIIEGTEFNNKSGVWLDAFYAKENNLKVGDTITIKYDNISLKEKIIALINVPDHVYDVKDEAELFPNRKDFGFAYISYNELKDYIKEPIYNYIMVDVNDENDKSKVKSNIENNMNILAVIDIKDTASYSTYQGEIDEGKTYVGVFSGLFLFIAMLSIITTMTRVVNKQRIQIGTLKALGFKDSKIVMHYVSYALFIGILASICGILLGYFFIGNIFISIETSVFEIPNGNPHIGIESFIITILINLAILLITYMTCKSILKENPSETLKNKLPEVKKHSLDITTKGIFKKMSFSTKWNIRDMFRNKVRTLMGIIGTAGSCMLIVCAMGMLDSMNNFIKIQFDDIYNFNYKISLMEDISDSELKNIKEKYENDTSMTLNIETKRNDIVESNTIFINDSHNKVRTIDKNNNFMKINNNNGVYITNKLALNDGYNIGDTIKWHIYGSDKYYESKIVGFNKDPQNQNITMTKEYLESLNIKYKENTIYTNENLSKISNINGVSSIQNKSNLKDGMTNMLSMMKTMITLIIFIACILGVVIIYNLGILSYTEKQYQFATLKVLGLNDKKIKKIFIKQNNIISIISIIIGLPLGYFLVDWLFKVAIDEHYDFSAYIKPETYIISTIFTIALSYLVSKFLSRKISKIDMVSSLKSDE